MPYSLYVLVVIFTATAVGTEIGTLTIAPSKQVVERYGSVFFDINSSAPYTNPYNPDDIRVDIVFADPNSNQIVLPCFYVSENSGASRWQGRFTP